MYGRRKQDVHCDDGKYSNFFEIGFNGYAFIFEFVMVTSTGETRRVGRIVLNPADAEEFSQLLADAVNEHVNKYGPIKRVQVTAAAVT